MLKKTSFFYVVAVALLWTLIEWLRGIGELGVPGGFIAYTQYLNSYFIQIASIGGIHLVSFIIVLFNIAAAKFFTGQNNRLPILIAIFLVSFSYSYGYQMVHDYDLLPKERSMKIGIIQPNFDQGLKMIRGNNYSMLAQLESMTKDNSVSKPDIVVWPETAIMSNLKYDGRSLAVLQNITKTNKCLLIVGAYSFEKGLHNSMYFIAPDGAIIGRYDKEHLMPFGEYLPLKSLVYPLLKSTGYFEQDQTGSEFIKPVTYGTINIGPAICFETLFSGLIRKRAKNSDVIISITNDAWFGTSFGAYQHIMAAPFRAIENRRNFVQVANTGISAVVDPMGRFIIKTALNAKTQITSTIYLNN